MKDRCTAIRPNSSLRCLRIEGHATPHGDSLGDWGAGAAGPGEREAFEKAAEAKFNGGLNFTWDDEGGFYVSAQTYAIFWAWQARAAVPPAPANEEMLKALLLLVNLTDQGREGGLILSRADRKPITNGDQDVIDKAFIAADAAIRNARAAAVPAPGRETQEALEAIWAGVPDRLRERANDITSGELCTFPALLGGIAKLKAVIYKLRDSGATPKEG